MNSDQLVIREFLRANPDVTDTPVVLRKELFNGNLRGVMNWPRTEDALVTGTCFYQCELPDLAKLFTGISIRLAVWKPKTHRDVAKVLFETYGVIASLDDIAPTPMSYDPLPDTVTLTTLPGALTLKGSLTVLIYQKVMDLDEILTVREIDGVIDRFPLSNSLTQLEKKYYGYDFTDVRSSISWYPVGHTNTASNTPLTQLLNSATLRNEQSAPAWSWGVAVYIDYDANEMRCVYNGPTTGWPGANTKYKRCCVWKDARSLKSNKGHIIMHYDV